MPKATAQKMGCTNPRTSQTKATETATSKAAKKTLCAMLSFILSSLSVLRPPCDSVRQRLFITEPGRLVPVGPG